MQANSKKTMNLIICALFAALIAIGAFLKIPIPNVPFTLQTLFVLLAGMLLGGRRGAVSVCVYLAVGLAGLPVFTQGGGVMYIFKPTFGYLFGFAACAYVTGKQIEQCKKNKPTFWRMFSAGLLGLCTVYILGAAHLFLISRFYLGSNTGVLSLLISGVVIFLPADLLSCAASALIAKKMRPATEKYL